MFSANSSQVSGDALYVEDVFSTYLYTGNGSNQVINNGIDFSTKGGLLWIKKRSAIGNNFLYDTTSGAGATEYYPLYSNTTAARQSAYQDFWNFRTNGFELDGSNANYVNTNNATYASWSFRKAPKFFDVVTYTGNGVSGRTVAHSLGVAPGTIIVKRTDVGAGWRVYHRSQPNGYGDISSTDAFYTNSAERVFGNGSTVVAPTSTDFTIGDATSINGSGATFVAYLFAHDTTSDGIIQCGSYTEPSSGETEFTLGWEPQWLLVKRTDSTSDWQIFDNMRAMSYTNSIPLRPNSSGAEFSFGDGYYKPTPRGFIVKSGAFGAGSSVVYIAIRRGPMRTPTSGTSVYSPVIGTTASATTITTGFPVDMMIFRPSRDVDYNIVQDRLRGGTKEMYTQLTDAESTIPATNFDRQTSVVYNAVGAGGSYVAWNFKRAPSFFDEVCYTGTGSARTINHNLGVAPELIITKCRSNGTTAWMTYCSALSSPNDKYLFLNQNSAVSTVAGTWKTPTATTFGMDISFTEINNSGFTYVSYLFASCPGVSKVGSYTGNGSSQTINCGFTNGARFVMIKRTDDAGSWFVWDTARGITSGNDPYLRMNSTGAEAGASYNSIDPNSSGFVVVQSDAAQININGATYIYLAVA